MMISKHVDRIAPHIRTSRQTTTNSNSPDDGPRSLDLVTMNDATTSLLTEHFSYTPLVSLPAQSYQQY